MSSSFAFHAWTTAVTWSGFGDNDDNNSRNNNRILQVSFHYTNTYHYYYFRSYCRCGCSFWYVSSALKSVRLFVYSFLFLLTCTEGWFCITMPENNVVFMVFRHSLVLGVPIVCLALFRIENFNANSFVSGSLSNGTNRTTQNKFSKENKFHSEFLVLTFSISMILICYFWNFEFPTNWFSILQHLLIPVHAIPFLLIFKYAITLCRSGSHRNCRTLNQQSGSSAYARRISAEKNEINGRCLRLITLSK